ncbi:uncharacterized protein Pyn_32460 [Prunus yedoensis var. nudiflora]|uniref:Uncharacterized protein n=1 Tax=Prunus yedoensis var. nudiflora TaxID=2094558 RepID=A0A315B1G8_PRUYE|nr:uncharacterized protein Pyn_32460 [Prunus yedoensis var. nudiflora]
MRPGSERNGSKSGRPPLKKLSDRKAFACPGHISTNGSPDFAGESGDDREELLAAAAFACNSRKEASYLKEQLICMEENDECISLMFGNGSNVSGDIVHEENFASKTLASGSKERNLQDHIQNGGISRGRLDSEGMKKVPPLYQRVLDVSSTNVEPRNRVGIQFANETNLGPQTLNQCSIDSLPCNGTSGFANATGICNQILADDLSKVDFAVLHSGSGLFPAFSENGCPYEQMSLEDRLLLELQSVGLYQETVPDLSDGDDEAIDQDIVGLQKLLHQQVDGKKKQLNKFIKAIEESMDIERRRRDQVAMDQLVESAYRKLLATRGSIASKYKIAKVPKHVAVAYTKRTLARCRKYEENGISCFNEPALRDVIFAAPLHGGNAEPMKCNGLSLPPENQNSHQEPVVSGSSNWAEQHDHLNKYGRDSDGTFGSLTHRSTKDFAKNGPIFYRGKKKEVLLEMMLAVLP